MCIRDRANIVDGCVEYIPQKTKLEHANTVRVPLNQKALEHEYVTVDRIGCTQSAQIGIVHFVPLFKSKIERVTINGLGNLVPVSYTHLVYKR